MKRIQNSLPKCTALNSLGLRCGHNAIPNSDRCQFHPLETLPVLTEADEPAVEDLPFEIENAQQFAQAVLHSVEFREYIARTLRSGKISAAIILRLMDYAEGWGKPPERIEHTGKDGDAIVTEVRRVIVHTKEEEKPISDIESIVVEDEGLDLPMIPVAPRRMH